MLPLLLRLQPLPLPARLPGSSPACLLNALLCAPTHPTLHPAPRLARMSARVLDRIAREQGDAPLGPADRSALALTYGFSHGAAHSAFFFAAWLPLALGDGTLYLARCPRMSVLLVGALSTLGLAALLTGAMVLSFDALERRNLAAAAAAPAAHTAAALLTLVNFADGGCLVSVPLLLVGGAAVAAAAGRVWWRRTTAVPRLLPAERRSATAAAAPGSSGGGGAEPVAGSGGSRSGSRSGDRHR